jgi:alpha-tubulin suppressor-like RCC1 family protein
VLADVAGRCFVWGRNEKGQLGLGDTINRTVPVLLEALSHVRVTGGACGRHHTAVVTAQGESFAWGMNAYGQLGTGVVKKIKGGEDVQLTPQPSLVSRASGVACGAEFTVWIAGGKLWSAGLPQYGQLGHGSDHEYNVSDSSVKMVFEAQPTPALIVTLAEKSVTRLACGHNHSVAVCSDGGVWTWGFGGYGRLGHRVQQDEFRPRLVEALTGRITVPADAVVAAGQTSSFCTMAGGQLMAWGKLKTSGDNLMYPTPYYELSGWSLKSMACGSTTFAVAATAGGETSAITWGHSNGHGELGYGEGGKKSSASPEKCEALEGVPCEQVAMGYAHTLFLVDADHEKVKAAPEWDAPPLDDAAPPPAVAFGAKRKAPAPAKGAKGKAKKK